MLEKLKVALLILLFLLFSLISLSLFLLFSPILVPSLLGFYFICRVLGLWPKVLRLIEKVYDWLLFESDKPRKFAWRTFYNMLCWMFPQDEWKTMNYGYAVSSDSGHTIRLAEEEESERFSYQLYHLMATGFKKLTNLNGLNVVEVGSGRGGGLGYVVRNLKPGSALGVDYSKQQVEFCKKTYKYDNINFIEGDAENLPIKDESVDLVLNVESCHCYGNLQLFIRQVARILKPGGFFMITDFMLASEVDKFEKILTESLEIVEKKDITENVILSLQKDSSRRMELIMNRTPAICRRLLKRFSGAEGSNIFQQLSSKQSLYLAYKLKKA